MKNLIVKLLILTTAVSTILSPCAIASVAKANSTEILADNEDTVSDDDAEEEVDYWGNPTDPSLYEYYTITVTYDQDRARKLAELTNEFRTSDTWYYADEEGNKTYVSGLEPLIYDYGLEKVAMLRAAEGQFRFDVTHERPNGGLYAEAVSDVYPERKHSWASTIYSENGAWGDNQVHDLGTPEQAIDGLKETDKPWGEQGHRINMLDPNHKYFAVGCVKYTITIPYFDYDGNLAEYTYDKYVYNQFFEDEPFDYPANRNSGLFDEPHYISLEYTEPCNETKEFTTKVLKSTIVDNDAVGILGVRIPYGAVDSKGNVHECVPEKPEEFIPDEEYYTDDPNNNSNNQQTPSSNIIKTYYKSKVDLSSYFASVDGAIKTKYKSSNKSMVKVNKKGIATGGKSAGTAEITKYVKYSKQTPWEEVSIVSVTNYVPTLPKKQSISVGEGLPMNSYLSGTDEIPVDWVSSNPSVVSITSDGIATAVSTGKAKVTPIFSTGKAKIKTTIKVQ